MQPHAAGKRLVGRRTAIGLRAARVDAAAELRLRVLLAALLARRLRRAAVVAALIVAVLVDAVSYRLRAARGAAVRIVALGDACVDLRRRGGLATGRAVGAAVALAVAIAIAGTLLLHALRAELLAGA